LIIVEATGVAPEGRITPFCAGIWKDEHIASHKDVVDFAHENSAKIGIQLAHAGRKASTVPPYWNMGLPGQAIPAEEGGWTVVAPSSIPFADDFPKPVELSILEIKRIQNDFRLAASRALEAGYDVIEIHGAHGYLNTSFCSPLTNQRTDECVPVIKLLNHFDVFN
jgi:2,4-dienoyl-CoA reductase-like NADH-dependent reductase (Old Yellow Enzyme family)